MNNKLKKLEIDETIDLKMVSKNYFSSVFFKSINFFFFFENKKTTSRKETHHF